MRIQLAGVTKSYGAQPVLEAVTLAVGGRTQLGLVGPNGVGKSTLLRILAGVERPDGGTVAREPADLRVGYLPQEVDARPGETLLGYLGRRTGVAQAESELERLAAALAEDGSAGEAYSAALERFLALGGGDLEPRSRAMCAELGLPMSIEQETAALSGGEAARAALASILLSRFDVLLLDEPTNDLDFDGLERLERFLARHDGAIVVVSHDREFLDRTVTRVAEIERGSRGVREWAGGWSDFESARDAARQAACARFEESERRRRELEELLTMRRTEARATGGRLAKASGGADRRGTHALMTKVRQAERLLERADAPEKPFEPWELRLKLAAARRPGRTVAALESAVGARGAFRLGPIDLDLAPGERLAITGRNGSGKTTLLGMLLGSVPLVAGRRLVGRSTVFGVLGQERGAHGGDRTLLATFREETGLMAQDARTLLAKFGLGADHVGRPGASLSPGERTRAGLASFMARGVNVLVLDEPTNHLDLEAIEQLESALASYDGTAVVVSHDRRFLERFGATRALDLETAQRRYGGLDACP
jgi:ATPase subunit of ABC transporter with duplicated ATPase domains